MTMNSLIDRRIDNKKETEPEIIELTERELEELLCRVKNEQLTRQDYALIEGLLNTFFRINSLLEEKNLSIKRLLRLFGKKSEKAKDIFKDDNSTNTKSDKDKDDGGKESAPEPDEIEQTKKSESEKEKEKKPGHGKNGASSYVGAKKIEIGIEGLKASEICPSCESGKLYNWKPGKILRIKGASPIKARVYHLEKLRCTLCQKIFSAQLPKEAGNKKYDEKSCAMVGLLKYGFGMPFHRLGILQKNLGIPLPPSTQWDMVKGTAEELKPVYQELLWKGAQGEVIHNDDTVIKILELMMENKSKNPEREGRKGIFTTGIVSKTKDHKIALFFSGRNHAGENLTDLLDYRHTSLPPPIQMCDALSRNLSPQFKTLLAYCLLHGRRNFVDTLEAFPQQSRYVIEKIGKVYHNEAIAKELKMTPSRRLEFHQQESKVVMDELRNWLVEQFEEKKVEPNSSLGKAIKYMLNHWEELTLFLRVEGAPLDNNIVERSLKMVILNRKNAYFYRTQNGADVGDIFMSIIQTCKFETVNAFEYLTVLQKYALLVKVNPSEWLPWNYKNNMAEKILVKK